MGMPIWGKKYYTTWLDKLYFWGVIMLGYISVEDKIYIVCGYTDMRRLSHIIIVIKCKKASIV